MGSLRARSPYGAAVLMGSTSLRARCPHGVAVLMGFTSSGARPPAISLKDNLCTRFATEVILRRRSEKAKRDIEEIAVVRKGDKELESRHSRSFALP
jgi:hypothetical protein